MSSEQLPPHPEIPLLPPEKLSRNNILGEIRDHIKDFDQIFPYVDLDVLFEQVTDVGKKQVDQETQLRQFLRAFRKTPDFKEAFSQLDESAQKKIQDFSDGKSADELTVNGFHPLPSPATKRHFRFLDVFNSLFHHSHDSSKKKELEAKAHDAPKIYEDTKGKHLMKIYADTEFVNWGESVKNKPKYTCVPTTVLGVQNLIKWAKVNDKRVRCAGYRHSWSPTFSTDNEVLISLLDLKEVTRIPDPLALGFSQPTSGNELMSIDILKKPKFSPSGKDCVRVGVAVTNEWFRRWAIKNQVTALPMDVILVEVTIGGVNGPICHGAGRAHKTLSDQVVAIEYVDANGQIQTITDQKQLKAAAGCFGLLGVVTHITFELEAMTYAVMKPKKPPISLAIPPLKQSDIPAALYKKWKPEEIEAAQKDFENRATNDFYAEWFWYTYQTTAWVNSWNPVSDPEGAKEYPTPAGVFLQWLQTWIGGWFSQTFFFHHIPAHWQAQFLAVAGMAVLPPTTFAHEAPTIKTFLPDGLHFFRGIQNTRVRDMEWEVPLPAHPTIPNAPDLSIVQRAWWDVISLVYADAADSKVPMRLTLELRIMGGSDMIMAPQRGNDYGTASIEVLTVPGAAPTMEEWEQFKQKVADVWMSYEGAGGKVNSRPHWAKEWQSLQASGLPIRQYLKEHAYKDAIPEFKGMLAEIGKTQGWELADIQKRFSNQMWDEIVYA